eukprot:TRINITY_DN14319_c0_g1_i1.p1 TRINITY_DN14319_c0_g1~~TRINITY_DN14319_c0_g1_i1.p1  ORF type:complete len:547 (-),score=120.39 TRINITY_DN14319_c0_g1_i1:153-1793(-)
MKSIKKEQIEFVTAPYLASAQINYLYSKGAVQAVYGPWDLLCFAKVPVIVAYDDKQFQWTSDEVMLEKLELSREKLEEFSLLWTYPIETFDWSKDLLAVSEAASNKPQVRSTLAKFQTLYKYPIIFDSECVCRTLVKSQKLPKEIEELIGIKLPTKCYLYLLLGLVSGKLLSIISSGKLFEYSYIFKGNTLHGFNLSNKAGNYGVLVSLLKGCMAMRPYIEKFNKLLYIDRIGSVEAIIVGEPSKELYWNITRDKVTKELARQEIKDGQVSALFCIRWLGEVSDKAASLKKTDKLSDTRHARELACHVTLMCLEQRNFISATKGTLSLGDVYKTLPAQFHDEGLLFLELLGYSEFSGFKEKAAREEKVKWLVAEVLSLVSMRTKVGEAEEWNRFVIPKEFAAFLAVAKSAWSSSRDFVEGILFDLFCSTDESKAFDAEEFERAFELLPFRLKPNFLLGLIMLWILNEPESKELIEEANKVFSLGEDIRADVVKGLTFWRSIMIMVSSLYARKDISQDKYELFIDANELLKNKFEVLGIKDNHTIVH